MKATCCFLFVLFFHVVLASFAPLRTENHELSRKKCNHADRFLIPEYFFIHHPDCAEQHASAIVQRRRYRNCGSIRYLICPGRCRHQRGNHSSDRLSVLRIIHWSQCAHGPADRTAQNVAYNIHPSDVHAAGCYARHHWIDYQSGCDPARLSPHDVHSVFRTTLQSV